MDLAENVSLGTPRRGCWRTPKAAGGRGILPPPFKFYYLLMEYLRKK
jgi:hypothetical protein